MEPISPIWSSCAFSASNFYEETSTILEDSLNFALIPESCCLLNDVTYPLDYVEEFYWTPWKSVQHETKFFLKEFQKIEGKLAKVCANVTPFSDTDVTFFDEEFPDSDDLLDTANFKELKLQTPSNNDNYGLLEVPYIRNPALQLEPEKSFHELLRNIPPIELEDVFKRESNLTFDKSFEEENFLESVILSDKLEIFPGNFERFKEIVLPKIPGEDLSLELLSLNSKRMDLTLCSRNVEQFNVKSKNNLEEEMKFIQNLIQPCQNLFIHKPSSDIKNFIGYKSSKHDCTYLSSESGESAVFNRADKTEMQFDGKSSILNFDCELETNEVEAAFDRDDKSEMQFNGKSSIINFDCELETSDIEEPNSDIFIYSDKDDYITNVKCLEKMDDNFSEICNDDFFSETFTDSSNSNDAVDNKKTKFNSFQYVNEQNLMTIRKSAGNSITSVQPREEKSFLEKLSKLDLVEQFPEDNIFIPKEIRTDSENVLKSSTVFRNKALEQNNELVNTGTLEQISKHQYSFENETKADVSQSQGSIYLLSSFLRAKKKENELTLSFESRFSDSQASEKNNRNIEDLENVIRDADTNYEENMSSVNYVEAKIQLLEEDISVKFPDDYIKLILTYENSVTFYVQKLALWEKFKLSPDLTIMNISLDKTRFLLNQEVKSCRDRNINPLEGGVRYSHYIQLLVLHGILKSLNCLIHFGAQLAVSSLYEYEAKHTGLLKGCFQNLIDEVSIFTENLSKTDSTHPKIKELSIYLQQKYYFCKENTIAFKVVIVLKEHLNVFYSEFEAYMKTLLPEISIDLIPESDYLERATDYFSGNEEEIYVVCMSSISKNISWKNITFLIEYQTDKNCWKSLCKKENIFHFHITFDSLPLKTLDDIKHLPTLKDPPCKKAIEVKEIPIVTSASISLEYDMKSLCNLEQNISIFERDYKRHLPDMHFADVDIDYRTSVIIIRLTEFSKDCTFENLTKKIFNMHLKYDVCWIIVHDDLTHRGFDKGVCYEIQQAFIKFYFTAVTMKFQQSFKVKFLYGKSNEDIKRRIASVLSKNLKCLLPKSGKYPISSFTADMTNEELFLVSFPSFNPFIASFILSHKISFFELMNLKLEKLHKKFYPVPERFLKHFYSLIHEANKIRSSYQDFQENVYGNLMKSDQISRNSNLDFLSKKFNSNTNELINFITCLEKDHCFEDRLMTDFAVQTPKNKPEECKTFDTDDYSEMSVEEIDRNYTALKLQDVTHASFDIGFENDFDSQSIAQTHASSSHSISPDTVSHVDNYSIVDLVPKKRKHDDFIFQEDFNDICIEENQIHCSSESKSSKDLYQIQNFSVRNYIPYRSNSFHKTAHASKLLRDAHLQNIQRKKLSLSQSDNELIMQDDLKNVYIKESQTSYSNELRSTKSQNLKCSMRNYLPYESSSYDETMHVPPILGDRRANLQNVQVKNINLSQYDNKSISQKDFNNICIEESQMYYSSVSKCSKHPYHNLRNPTRNHLPYRSDDFDETKHASHFLEDNDENLENVQAKQSNLSKYLFKKRKNADFDSPSPSKFTKYSSQNLVTTSPLLQKGQSSKNVCKQVSFKNSPIFCGDESDDFSSSYNGLCSSTAPQFETSTKFNASSSNFPKKSDSIGSGDIDSSWMSQSTITLTPRTSHRLAYEKIPGKKGQTRLIFQ